MSDLPTGTVTFLCTDIARSASLWEKQTARMDKTLARHDALVRQSIERHNGQVFKTVGDGVYAVFATAPEAVAAALSLQKALLSGVWQRLPLRVRIALHTGTPQYRANDYFGPPVNRVARLLGIGHGGQILLSEATQSLVRSALPEGASLIDLGWHHLRGLTDPERVFQLTHPALPSDFPPLNSLDVLPANLPVQLTRFIGRGKEIGQVTRLLSRTRLLTLTGAGGCGKTRLALRVAEEVLEDYPDGVWLVELAALTDSSLVVQAIASVLNVREERGHPLLRTLIASLKEKRLLLLLDNCEHLLAACAPLADTLLRACPQLRILATTQEAIGLAGELTYRVPALSLPGFEAPPSVRGLRRYESIRLFEERAQLRQPAFKLTHKNASFVAEICRRLDGIPLAIELAAAYVPVLPLRDIASRLNVCFQRFQLLIHGSPPALPKQQTLRAMIDWSYGLLDTQERHFFACLAVFAGGWTLEAAEAVCSADAGIGYGVLGVGQRPIGYGKHEGNSMIQPSGTDPNTQHLTPNTHDVLNLLTALVAKNLVVFEEQQAQGRYRLLETISEYARERLQESGEESFLRRRHADFYRRLAEEAETELAGARQAEWLEGMEREHDNFRAALAWCRADPQEKETGLRLAAALWRFWWMRGFLQEGRYWLKQMLAWGEDLPATVRAKGLNRAGNLAWSQADYETARAFFEQSLALAQEVGDRENVAYSLNGLGAVAADQCDFAGAEAYYAQSLALKRELGDRAGIAVTLSNLAESARWQGDYARATTLIEQSLAITREAGDRLGVARLLHNLADVERMRGDTHRAGLLYKESLEIRWEMQDRRGIAFLLEGIATLAAEQATKVQANGTALARAGAVKAAQLYGAAGALRKTIGASLPPSEQQEHQAHIDLLHTILEQDAFEAAWKEGQAMRVEQVVQMALQEKEVGTDLTNRE